jgi:hypothetical protein
MSLFKDKENLIKCDKTNQEELACCKHSCQKELKSYFESISLSSAQKHSLEARLLSNSNASMGFAVSFKKLASYKSILFSHFLTVVVAAAITLFVVARFHSTNDLPHDLSDNLNFPADFDLDGNLNDLPDLINDSLPNHSFSPTIPKQIAQDFSAYEGRFFLFKGQQGVGMHGFKQKHPSTLYIVKLSDQNKASFPAEKMIRKVLSASGKLKRIYAWNDGAYGYAMVQPLGTDDENFQR